MTKNTSNQKVNHLIEFHATISLMMDFILQSSYIFCIQFALQLLQVC